MTHLASWNMSPHNKGLGNTAVDILQVWYLGENELAFVLFLFCPEDIMRTDSIWGLFVLWALERNLPSGFDLLSLQ